jgi:hypothetical protein
MRKESPMMSSLPVTYCLLKGLYSGNKVFLLKKYQKYLLDPGFSPKSIRLSLLSSSKPGFKTGWAGDNIFILGLLYHWMKKGAS